MKVSDFVFDYVHLLCYKSHKINLNRSGWNRKPPGWIKNKKGAINPINEKDNKCFQYAVTVSWNHEEIKKDPQRIKEIKPFIKKFKCEWIKFPSEEDDWKKFEKINVTIPFNILYAKKEKIYSVYVSKHNSNGKKASCSFNDVKRNKRKAKSEQLLWHYLAVNKLSALLRGITLKRMVIFIVKIALIPLEQNINLNRIKDYVNIKILWCNYAFWRHIKY